jgi:hypothetical protein
VLCADARLLPVCWCVLQIEKLSWDATSKLLAAAVGNDVLVW